MHDLASLLPRLSRRPVLVVGDVMLDRFIWGDVDRISPEAPVPVVRVREESACLGGAANVAANLASLGVRAVLVGLVGDDPAGAQMREALAEAGIDGRMVGGAPRTTVKTRVIARAQQVVRVDRESEHDTSPEMRRSILHQALAALEDAGALVVSDYDKGVIAPGLLAALLPRAASLGIPVVVDPKLSHVGLYQPATVLTPNQKEAGEAAAMPIRTDADCLEAARTLLRKLELRAVLVTRGERGMMLVERDREPESIPAAAREVYDVTGAGDTVVAVLATALGAGATLSQAARLANHAGGIVVGKVGTATVTLEELGARLAPVTPAT